ncbi:MAG: radical SAM protein [Candidatus Omnitrophota bacterium]|nr:radical SAM protein [Candidatus Omnitrophota bacterium]
MPTRVAILAHVVTTPTSLPVPSSGKARASVLQLYNYTRVLTEDQRLVDHVTYLKEELGLAPSEAFSVWEMYLCSGLLLASHLERHGIEAFLVNYVDSENLEDKCLALQAFDPDIVVLSTTFILTKKHLVEAGWLIRRWVPRAFVVAGGHHVYTTLMYMDDVQQRRYLLESQLDAFVNDVQGEGALLDLARAWPKGLTQIPNLIWRDADGTVHMNERTAEQNDVNATPLEFERLKPGSVIHMRTARSCAFKCAFCSYPTIAGKLALMELENALATIRRAKDAGVSAVFFVDDTFNVPRERFERLIDLMIERGLEIPWYSFLRCQFVDGPLVEKMRRSGCQGVFLGIESGSDRILANMNKGSATTYYGPGIRWLRDQGIITVGAFIIGFPGETKETAEETETFITRSGLDFYFLQPFYYLHHTPIHQRAAQYQLRGQGLNWSHATMNAAEASRLLDQMFMRIEEPVAVNPDYTLWEVAYLLHKGLDMPRIRDYRRRINRMTVNQMQRKGGSLNVVTSQGLEEAPSWVAQVRGSDG